MIKRELTAVFLASLVRDFLLPQTIYTGKTPHCLPTTKFPKDWDITFTQNYWANEKTAEAHIMKILATYIETCKKKLSLLTDHAAIVMFDRFTGQCSSNIILSLLDSHHIDLVIVPPNCTNHLQPLDVIVNKAMKENPRKQFQNWFYSQVYKTLMVQ